VEVNGAGDRVLYAAWLYRQGKAPYVLLTGGRIAWLGTGDSPAGDMASLLELMGVPPDAIWLESESRNTYENAVNSRQILEAKGIQRILLVTSAMHMPRSVALFRKQGLEVIPAPTDFSITQENWDQLVHGNAANWFLNLAPQAGNLATTTEALKEYLGMFIYHLQGWL
jgi:uncharacterized SAM-binding protein YcdF (DUF218 family)